MNLLSLNLDEIIYRLHVMFIEPLIYLITFKWIWGSSAAEIAAQGGLGAGQDASLWDRLFGSTLFRIFSGRPSAERNSLEELRNPSDEKGIFEYLFDILFGRPDQEGIFQLLFGTVFGWFILLALLSWLLYYLIESKVHFLSEKEKVMYDLASSHVEKQESNDKATRWQKILENVNSDSENNWKIAIMDADILLDEILEEQGFEGAGVAERLKQVGPEYASSVQYAWNGHKTRNRVAHEVDFTLTARDARMAISMYEKFFAAFYTS